ncbi:MAG: hypothetical protein GIW99_00820 [Candidatus Eremiobacteraeota bacterium]|nr:hypothetical protein [Candidatus Eremiobacteraeota bacterium]MBC5826228.1 hypothetical protein [Candidatus Eremiobacteraeota bacterium]
MSKDVLSRALELGFVSGLRSLTPPAAIALSRGGGASLLLCALAIGELVGDKLPRTPARTVPAALLFRTASGGFAGATISRAAGQPDVRAGAICGAVGALAGTFAGYEIRRRATADTGLPDFAVALVEDALAVWAALKLTPGDKRSAA